jgi:hypothetical protein
MSSREHDKRHLKREKGEDESAAGDDEPEERTWTSDCRRTAGGTRGGSVSAQRRFTIGTMPMKRL